MTEMRRPMSYREVLEGLVAAASKTLLLSDLKGPRPWWSGVVKYPTYGHRPELLVGGFFELRDHPYPAGQRIGRYRVVAMALTEEFDYFMLGIGAREDELPVNGAPMASIDFSMLVKNQDINVDRQEV